MKVSTDISNCSIVLNLVEAGGIAPPPEPKPSILSAPFCFVDLAGATGLEPVASSVTG